MKKVWGCWFVNSNLLGVRYIGVIMIRFSVYASLAATLTLVGKNIWSIAAFALAFYLLRSATFVPLQAWLLHNALEQTGQTSIVNFDLIGFLISPVGLIWLVVATTLSFVLLAAQQSGSLLSAIVARQGMRLGLTSKLVFVVRQLPRISSACLVQTAALLAMVAAYGGYLGLIGADLLASHDINYFLTDWPPEFVRFVVLAAIGAAVLISGFALLSIIWTMALPVLVTGSGWWAIPLVEGWRASYGNRIRIAAVLVAWSLLAAGLLALIGSALYLVSHLTIGLFPETIFWLVATAGVALVISHVILGFTEMALVSGYAFLAEELWFRATGAKPVLPSTELVEKSSHQRSGRRIMLAAAVVVVGALSAGAAFALIETAEFRRDTLVIAHRGASQGAPENTLAAFQQAIDEGADAIELDVQQTADGEIVVIHDKDVKRVTGADGNVWELTAAEISRLDAGSSFSQSFKGTQIPTLAQTADLAGSQTSLMIELKINGHNPNLTRDVLDLARNADTLQRYSFISLDYDALQQIRRLDPDQNIGLLISANIGNINSLDVDFLALSKSLVDPSLVAEAREMERPVYVWTIDDENEMFRMLDLGVDGIITNRPGVLRNLLNDMDALSETERLVLLIGRQLRGE